MEVTKVVSSLKMAENPPCISGSLKYACLMTEKKKRLSLGNIHVARLSAADFGA